MQRGVMISEAKRQSVSGAARLRYQPRLKRRAWRYDPSDLARGLPAGVGREDNFRLGVPRKSSRRTG